MATSLLRHAIAALALTVLAQPAALSGDIKLKKADSRKRAPAFELKDRDGRPVQLSDYAGRVVLLDFWATWCAPCRAAVPWMVELAEKYRDAGLTVIGISMDEGGWTAVQPFVDQHKVTYPIVLSTERVAYLYGEVDALPVAFFVDRNQRVAAIHVGAGNRKDFERAIQELLTPSR